MKKTIKSIFATSLAAILSVATLTGCGTSGNTPKLPEYSAKEYLFSAYSGPNAGIYSQEGVYKTLGPDQRTTAGYTTYKEAGFNLAWCTADASYSGEKWETSECKRAWDAALSAGMTNVLVTDARIDTLVEFKDSLVGTTNSCRFSSDEQLKDAIKDYLDDYINYQGFYGVRISDERDYTYINAVGKVYKAIRAAGEELGMPNIYIHLNVLPVDGVYSRFGGVAEDNSSEYATMTEAYNGYISKYIETTNCDRISSDVYAFRKNGITGQFYSTAQVIKEQANAHGIDASFCLQSFELYNGQTLIYKGIGKSEMKMELYSLMGMGYDHFYYYTYQFPSAFSSGWTEGYTFLNLAGEKTNVYYYGQQCMSLAQSMADIILGYDYVGGKFYISDNPSFDVSCYLSAPVDTKVTNSGLVFDNTHEFELIADNSVEFDNDVVFITELKDSVNNLNMYMLQNVINPQNAEFGRTAEKVSVKFDGGYTHVAELCDGQLTYVKLSNGKYTKTLNAGDAVYLIPLK